MNKITPQNITGHQVLKQGFFGIDYSGKLKVSETSGRVRIGCSILKKKIYYLLHKSIWKIEHNMIQLG